MRYQVIIDVLDLDVDMHEHQMHDGDQQQDSAADAHEVPGQGFETPAHGPLAGGTPAIQSGCHRCLL